MAQVLGIDLGSTVSVVAAAAGSRDAEVVPIGKKRRKQERTTPSFVSFDGRKVLVGAEARQRVGVNPAGTFRLPPGLIPGPAGPHPYELARHVAAGLLAGLHRRRRPGGPPAPEAVVAVPTGADAGQRAVYRDAVRDGGFGVRDTIGAAQAVVAAYGLDQALHTRALVFILGGLSLEVTVVEVDNGRVAVLGGGASHALGGEDWTGAVADHVAGGFAREHGVDLRADPVAWQRVFEACEAAKRELSTQPRADITLPYVHERRHLQASLTRDEFDALTAHLVDNALGRVSAVLGQCSLPPDGLNHVLMAGGGSLLPAVAEAVPARLGRPALPGPHPQEAVALGAAMSAWSPRL